MEAVEEVGMGAEDVSGGRGGNSWAEGELDGKVVPDRGVGGQ